jgi:hypothetical protein
LLGIPPYLLRFKPLRPEAIHPLVLYWLHRNLVGIIPGFIPGFIPGRIIPGFIPGFIIPGRIVPGISPGFIAGMLGRIIPGCIG